MLPEVPTQTIEDRPAFDPVMSHWPGLTPLPAPEFCGYSVMLAMLFPYHTRVRLMGADVSGFVVSVEKRYVVAGRDGSVAAIWK